jgi:transposase
VVPGAKRRTFSKAGKLRILAAADACNAPGDIGAPKRGPKPDPAAAQERKVRELENEVARLRDKLAKADLIIDVQKKLSILLGLSTASTPNEPK